MSLTLPDIQYDLDVKRTARLPQDQRPAFDYEGSVLGLPPLSREILVRGEDAARPFTYGMAAQIVGDALVTLRFARGNREVDTPENRKIVRDTVSALGGKLSTLPERTSSLTDYDLSVLIEAALIESGAFEVAKALVLQRAPSAPAGSVASLVRLIRRSGEVVPWNTDKIEVAIRKAFLSRHLDSEPAVGIADRVAVRVHGLGQAYVPIETVQDIVQEELVLGGWMKVAEAYIVYRAQRALLRIQKGAGEDTDRQFSLISVAEPDGSLSFWDGGDLRQRIQFASIGLDLCLSGVEIEAELRRSLPSEIRRGDLQKTILLNAKSLMERDADFAFFAGRILLSFIYEEVLGWDISRDGVEGLAAAHTKAFRSYLEHGAEIKRLSPDLLAYDTDTLARALDPTADLDFDYLGLQTLYDRYLLTDKTSQRAHRIETPQFFWMRVAMGLFKAETVGREEKAIALYNLYKNRRFCSSTPTLFNSGTPHSQLSSCYLYYVQDSIESIMYRGIAENAFLSKWAGGLGGSWTSVRGTGSYIQGTNGESQGVIPFLKMHNDQLVAINQGGKRAGSGCAYLEVWHNDIFDFLELRKNTGDERRRTHDMNTANWIPDLFMKRMEARAHWTLFRSSEVPDLHDLYGKAFEARYEEYERLSEAGKINGKKIEAIDLWKQMLKMLFETGHPWITFKDPCNVRSPQDHVGVIHSSNLCTEICLNTSHDETAVCNLGSVVLDMHLTPDGAIDHEKLRETIRTAVRALDNVIDINFYPTEAAQRANQRHRPIGLGVMGLQYALYKKGLAFATPEAVAFNDEMMEAVAYYAYEASSDLAAENGTYSTYKGSKWDRGLLPQDTIDLLEAERGEPIQVPRGGRLDWQPLRDKIKAQGMRNSNVLAIAPTATIANIMGTSPCIEPIYKNLFVKGNLSGDFVILNPYMVRDLKKEGIWNTHLVEQLKYFDGNLTDIDVVPSAIKERYRTAFQIPIDFVLDAAAVRQKWIDQSQSVNLFLPTPDLKVLSHMYRRAWQVGLKTTYYLRTLGASNIEKATVTMKKATPTEAPALPATDPVALAPAPFAAPLAPLASFAAPLTVPLAPVPPSVPVTVSAPPVVSLPVEPIRPAAEVDSLGSFTEAEKLACSIDAMRNGEECEACQ